MKNITKKLAYIILIEATNFGICAIPWIPSKFLELTLWGIFIGLTLLSIHLITKIIKESYKILVQKYSQNITYTLTSFIALSLIGMFGVINFINFLFFVFSGSYVNEYVFDGKKFYVYDTSFIETVSEISVKMDYLPIRKEIVSCGSSAKENVLYRDGDMVYFLNPIEKHNLYDLNKSTIVIMGDR